MIFPSDCAAESGGKPATIESYEDAVECERCGTKVRWDLVEDRFFGFKAGCPINKQEKK